MLPSYLHKSWTVCLHWSLSWLYSSLIVTTKPQEVTAPQIRTPTLPLRLRCCWADFVIFGQVAVSSVCSKMSFTRTQIWQWYQSSHLTSQTCPTIPVVKLTTFTCFLLIYTNPTLSTQSVFGCSHSSLMVLILFHPGPSCPVISVSQILFYSGMLSAAMWALHGQPHLQLVVFRFSLQTKSIAIDPALQV